MAGLIKLNFDKKGGVVLKSISHFPSSPLVESILLVEKLPTNSHLILTPDLDSLALLLTLAESNKTNIPITIISSDKMASQQLKTILKPMGFELIDDIISFGDKQDLISKLKRLDMGKFFIYSGRLPYIKFNQSDATYQLKISLNTIEFWQYIFEELNWAGIPNFFTSESSLIASFSRIPAFKSLLFENQTSQLSEAELNLHGLTQSGWDLESFNHSGFEFLELATPADSENSVTRRSFIRRIKLMVVFAFAFGRVPISATGTNEASVNKESLLDLLKRKLTEENVNVVIEIAGESPAAPIA